MQPVWDAALLTDHDGVPFAFPRGMRVSEWASKVLLLFLLFCIPVRAVGQSGASAGQPAAHWRFDEGPSSRTTADAGGLYPGTLSGDGAVLGAAGVAGGAISLSADAGGVVRMGNVLAMNSGPYSVSAWCKTPEGDTTTEAVILGKHTPWFENGYWLMLNGSGGAVAAYSSLGGFLLSPKSINDGHWHHLVVTVVPGGEMRLHIDGGAPVATGTAGTMVTTAAEFMIGGIDPPPPARRFNGQIDEVQIYGKSLAQEEVDFLHGNPGRTLADIGDLLITPPAGVVASPALVRLYTPIPGSEIRYTTDGSEPTLTSRLYSGPVELAVTATVTVRARVFVNTFPVSEVRSVTYEKDPGLRFTPPSGLFTNQVEVAIASSLAAVEVRFTLDGSVPTMESAVYASPVRLVGATTVRARAFLNGFPVTEVIDAAYRRVYVFDGDGIPGAWRERYFGPDYRTDPRAASAADPDQDRSTNLQEFTSGTDPLDATSGFGVVVRAIPEIRFATVAGQRYRVLRRSSAGGAEWETVNEFVATGSESVYADLDAGATVNPAFYLVEAVRE